MKTTRRKEHKYLITYKDYFQLQPLISTLLEHDKHQDDLHYDVNSIYFDDLVFSGASDKAFGNEYHKKYRVRYYHDINKMKLECKIKIAEDSTKYSENITKEIYNALVSGDLDMLEQHMDKELIRRYVLDNSLHHLQPRCQMIYQREAYKDAIDNLRITFDHSLKAGLEGSAEIPLLHGNQLILEVKYEHFIPKEIKRILQTIKTNEIAYSKYFLGFNSIYQ